MANGNTRAASVPMLHTCFPENRSTNPPVTMLGLLLVNSDPLVFLVHDKAKQRERYARVGFTVQMEDGGSFSRATVDTTATSGYCVLPHHKGKNIFSCEYTN
ncbi:hypothetical protein PVAP13_8NG187301 [Panicum virgatum]|uniref:Uncharacterized protein n=1 Tax=Panicum virgatum TaxID=38727 RepID=A0A8T0PDW8_PANVG|nr:hypothetical protein PVAP13_8NG187301 [Panicum virgatum]